MVAAPPRSLRDLHSDRRHLYADVRPVAVSPVRVVAAGGGMERGGGRDRLETVFPGTFRQDIGRALSGYGLERVDRLRRRPVVAAAAGAVVHRRRRLAL